ncbi:MAG: F0F1 ATP synthase subunit B [Hyphomicrobiales bacterium]|nr:F0F1 ATP synthase subunit B [Hyphomicrobiales bacterium]
MAEHETHAGTEAPGGAHEGGGAFPPFDTTHFASQLVWLAITFGLLYLMMSKIALPRVGGILKDRSTKISGDLEAAKAAQAKAEAARADQDKALADARAKAQAMGQATHQQLAAEADAKRKALESELNAKLAAADAQISDMKTKAMANVESIAKDAAAAIVQQITGKAADPQKIAAAIGEAAKG